MTMALELDCKSIGEGVAKMKFTTVAIVLIVFSCSTLAEVKPGTREVLLDNDKVEVVRLTYPVATESGMHTHKYPNRVAYIVKGGTLELAPDDPQKQAEVLTVPDGKVLFLPASTHNIKNVGDTDVVIIETEIK